MTHTPATYAIYSTGNAKAGSGRYHEGPKPGECEVEYDQTKHFYKIPRGMRSGFRAWVRDNWSSMNGMKRVAGAWPYYNVEN